MLSSIIDFGKDPYEAAVLPRMLPMRGDYTIEIETRLGQKVLRDLVKLGAEAETAASVRLSHGFLPAGVA